MPMMRVRVECYSGYRADERPTRFSLLTGGDSKHFDVREILDQWYGVGYQCFKVRADDGNVYILRHEFDPDGWSLDAFRRDTKAAPIRK
jgi:hypothetical protein